MCYLLAKGADIFDGNTKPNNTRAILFSTGAAMNFWYLKSRSSRLSSRAMELKTIPVDDQLQDGSGSGSGAVVPKSFRRSRLCLQRVATATTQDKGRARIHPCNRMKQAHIFGTKLAPHQHKRGFSNNSDSSVGPQRMGGGGGSRTYLMSLGEEFGEFRMPPFRCFFLDDSADCWSSSTATEPDRIGGTVG